MLEVNEITMLWSFKKRERKREKERERERERENSYILVHTKPRVKIG